MARARGRFEQGLNILDGWMSQSSNGLAYALLFESRGAPGDDLADVIDESQDSLDDLFQSGRWVRLKRRASVVGQITSLSVAGRHNDRWIVRRWLVVPTRSPLSVGDSNSVQELADGWALRLPRASGSVSNLREIHPSETASMMRLITACISPLDRPSANLRDIARDLGIQKPNETIPEMAERYRGASRMLRDQYEIARRRDDLQRNSAGIGFINPNKRNATFSEIVVPPEARDFINYAIDMFKIHTWKLTTTGESDGSKIWRQLIQRAGPGHPKYIAFDIRPSTRGTGSV